MSVSFLCPSVFGSPFICQSADTHCLQRRGSRAPPCHPLTALICCVANECIEENLNNKLCLRERKRKKRNTWISATYSRHSVAFYLLILCKHIFTPLLIKACALILGAHNANRQRMMWLLQVWLDFQQSLMTWNIYRATCQHLARLASAYLCYSSDSYGVTQQETQRYSRNAAQSVLCLRVWDVWGTVSKVVAYKAARLLLRCHWPCSSCCPHWLLETLLSSAFYYFECFILKLFMVWSNPIWQW